MSEYIVRVDGQMPCAIYERELTEIVRCRDCKRYTDDEMEYCHYCNRWCEQVEPAGFCAWGERNDGKAVP